MHFFGLKNYNLQNGKWDKPSITCSVLFELNTTQPKCLIIIYLQLKQFPVSCMGGGTISIWSICVEQLKALNRGQVKEGWHNIGIQLYASDMKFWSSCLCIDVSSVLSFLSLFFILSCFLGWSISWTNIKLVVLWVASVPKGNEVYLLIHDSR